MSAPLKAVLVIAMSAAAICSARAETVGPYEIVAAPTSATLIGGGGGGSFTWLNVVNTPVTINDAFTGFSVIDDGYVNAQSGTTIRMTFAPGALFNHVGPDLVLLDANNDLNVYLVSTSKDNFGSQIVCSATTDTGVDRMYFAGGQGPASYDVYGGTIDLSALGVLNGESVSEVQIFTEGPSNDPLALGVLASSVPIPAVSAWGLLAATLLLLAAGGWLALRQSPAAG